jgi:ferredoxin
VGEIRVTVDHELCEGNAICAGLAPELFEIGDDSRVRVLDEHPPDHLRRHAEEAVRRCPRQAIELDEG